MSLSFLKKLRLSQGQFLFVVSQAICNVPLKKVLKRRDMLLGQRIADIRYVYRTARAAWMETHL